MRTFWIGKAPHRTEGLQKDGLFVIDSMGRFRGHRLIEGDVIVFDESAKDLPDYWQLLEHAQVLEHLRRSEPSPKPQPKTIRVRIAVAMNRHGNWVAAGDSEETDEAMVEEAMEPLRSERGAVLGLTWVEANVDLPESVTVEGEVSDA